MRKWMFGVSIIGICTLMLTGIINQIMPKLGRMAYMIADSRLFDPAIYLADFSVINIIAACMLVSGLAYTFITSVAITKMNSFL